MNKPRIIDEAELKADFRRTYKEIGYQGMLQVLLELCVSVQLCIEVIREEYEKEAN